MVNFLNRLDHSISYDEGNLIETSIANEQMKNKICKLFVPNNILPSIFVTYVFDNCDHNPETLSGMVMHCTNGIMIQRSAQYQPQPNLANRSEEPCVKRRSCVAAVTGLHTYYAPAEKPNPVIIGNIVNDTNAIHEIHSQKIDFLWLLLRYYNEKRADQQTIPGWTGFYREISDTTDENPYEVHYLPTIERSTTKMEKHQEILVQIKLKSENIGLSSADAVFDHAIYSKCLEVVMDPKNFELQKYVHKFKNGWIPRDLHFHDSNW